MRKGLLNQHVTMGEAVAATPGGGGDAVGKVVGAVANVAGGVFGVITILILTFYMLVDSWSLREQALRLFPKHQRARVDAASRVVMEKVSAWLIGQLLLAGAIGGSSAIGLWALGIPFFYVLALLSAIGEMIPIVGPILSAIPAIAVASTLGIKKVIAVIIFFLIQQQLENHILVPKIMSRQVGVSPVTVIISLLIGGACWEWWVRCSRCRPPPSFRSSRPRLSTARAPATRRRRQRNRIAIHGTTATAM
jgi:predicted PurR-regulated permease PerM